MMSIVIEIESRKVELAGETITIGRSPTATLSLPSDARVADQHAVLRQVSGRWLIESRGQSTIRVGNGRPVQFAWLNAGDVIHLTEAGPQLTFCPATAAAAVAPAAPVSLPSVGVSAAPAQVSPPQNAPVVVQSVGSPTSSGASPWASHPAVWALGGAVLVLLSVMLTLSLLPRANSAPASQSALDRTIPEEIEDRTSREEVPVAVEPTDGTYLVLMSDPYQQLPQTRRVGMACAVAKRRLLTNASLVGHLLQQKSEVLTQISVQGVASSATATITKVAVHPEFQCLVEVHTEANEILEDLYKIVDDSPEQPIPDELRSKIVAAQNRLADALREEPNFDLAILDVDRDLPHVLAAASDTASVRPGTELTLVGFPFPKDETLSDPTSSPLPRRVTGSARLKVPHTATGGYWLAKFRETQPDEVWSGSPVLNRDGQVIGIYSHPYVAVPELGDPVLPDAHIVAPIGPLSAFSGGKQ